MCDFPGAKYAIDPSAMRHYGVRPAGRFRQVRVQFAVNFPGRQAGRVSVFL